MKLAPVEYRHLEHPSPVRDRAWQLRRNAVGLREVMLIAERWGLNQEQMSCLLGTAPRTLQRWRKMGEETGKLDLSGDTIERMSYLLGINKALTILFPTPANRLLWLRNGNQDAAFNGQAPIDRMLVGGQVADLFTVRHYLDAARG